MLGQQTSTKLKSKDHVSNLLDLMNSFLGKHIEDNPGRCMEIVQTVTHSINQNLN